MYTKIEICHLLDEEISNLESLKILTIFKTKVIFEWQFFRVKSRVNSSWFSYLNKRNLTLSITKNLCKKTSLYNCKFIYKNVLKPLESISWTLHMAWAARYRTDKPISLSFQDKHLHNGFLMTSMISFLTDDWMVGTVQ